MDPDFVRLYDLAPGFPATKLDSHSWYILIKWVQRHHNVLSWVALSPIMDAWSVKIDLGFKTRPKTIARALGTCSTVGMLQGPQLEGGTSFISVISWSAKSDHFRQKSSKVRRKADPPWRCRWYMNPNDTFSSTRRQGPSKYRLFRRNRPFFKSERKWCVLSSVFREPADRFYPCRDLFGLDSCRSNQIVHIVFAVGISQNLDVLTEMEIPNENEMKNVQKSWDLECL